MKTIIAILLMFPLVFIGGVVVYDWLWATLLSMRPALARKISWTAIIVLFIGGVLLLASCSPATSQEPSAINGLGAAIQATVEPKTAPKGETTKEVKALDFTAPQYFMTVQIYYYTACSHLFDEASEQSDCVKHALECAAKNVTDIKWLAGCLEVRE